MSENKNQHGKFPNRHLTVLRGNRQARTGEDVPFLQLTGVWMHEAGFHPGDKITIVINVGKLEIHKDRYA